MRVVEEDLRHDARLARVGDVEDGGAEPLGVGEVAEVRVAAFDVDLAGARQLEVRERRDVAGERSVGRCVHGAFSWGGISNIQQRRQAGAAKSGS
jgi:hypothetical protein